MSLRGGWLTLLKHTLNPLAMRAARSGRGPFWIVRHVGRKSGTVYETRMLDHPEIGAICAGGRYDNLAAYYTDRSLPGVGVDRGRAQSSSRVWVVKPPSASHSAAVFAATVTPKVQICPSGSLAR